MKKLFLNENGKISFTKIGAWLIALSQAMAQPGLLPDGVSESAGTILNILTAIGAALAAAGLRDAVSGKVQK